MRYTLYQWPDSQEYIGDDSAILIVNEEKKEEKYGSLSSSYMVPDGNGEFEKVENVPDEIHDRTDTLFSYDGEMFIPVITTKFLKENGFVKDESAPIGIERWHKQTKDYVGYYTWVLFQNNNAKEMFVRRNNYTPSGALDTTRVFSEKGNISIETFLRANNELEIDILENE